MLPGLLPQFLHTVTDQKLDGRKAWEQGWRTTSLLTEHHPNAIQEDSSNNFPVFEYIIKTGFILQS